MKVYAVRTVFNNSNYRPITGWLPTLADAKAWVKEHFDRNAEIEILQYDLPAKLSASQWAEILNADTLQSPDDIDLKSPKEFAAYQKTVFKNAAMKRYEKELK
jgi:phosphoribosylformylglycinamidine (FGAM) synthase-like enzyme